MKRAGKGQDKEKGGDVTMEENRSLWLEEELPSFPPLKGTLKRRCW